MTFNWSAQFNMRFLKVPFNFSSNIIQCFHFKDLFVWICFYFLTVLTLLLWIKLMTYLWVSKLYIHFHFYNIINWNPTRVKKFMFWNIFIIIIIYVHKKIRPIFCEAKKISVWGFFKFATTVYKRFLRC